MLNPQAAPATAGAADAGLVQAIVQLARDASIEINVHDVMHVEPSRALLPSGTKVYVSHLPKQTWQEAEAACRVLRAAGFLPVPHLPKMPDPPPGSLRYPLPLHLVRPSIHLRVVCSL
jgi:hypothetical protein